MGRGRPREPDSGTNSGVRPVGNSSIAATPDNEGPTGGMDTERTIHHYRDAGAWPAEQALTAMLDNQLNAFAAVRLALPSIAIAATGAAERLRERGRLIYCGAGASGRLAIQDGVELHPTFGWPVDRLVYLIAGGRPALISSIEGAEDDADAGAREAAAINPCQNDVLVAVAASGTTPYTRAVQKTVGAAGALTIALAHNCGAPLLATADHPVLLDSGPEFLAGSTRRAAGTAQKIALNLFSTRLMTELGRVYQGYMVNMVPGSEKLVARAQSMVAAIAGVPAALAASILAEAGGNVKVAVLMLDGLKRAETEAILTAVDGRLDRARNTSPLD